MLKTTNSEGISCAADSYYKAITSTQIDTRIRNECIKIANEAADEIIKKYHIKRFVKKIIKNELGGKDKLIIALELEKETT